jgi:hypothetical protein
MSICPHCKKDSISPFKKAILSPGLLATCKACGKPSTLRYKSWLIAMIPGSILLLAALFVDSKSIEWTLNIIGLLLIIILPYFFSPLHKEEI